MKTNLYNLTLAELEEYFISLGEKKFRAKQVFKWMYEKRAPGFGEMSNLPVPLRDKLQRSASLTLPVIADKKRSKESPTVKYLLKLKDNEFIETVFIHKPNRTTICISSQLGCALNCGFCATGSMGFKRNLTAGEIAGQLLSVSADTGETITNVVVMGMGEPFLNYEQVIKALDILSDDNGTALAPRRITISTIGIIPMIKKYTDDLIKANLAVSLNAATDMQRDKLMPGIKKYPLKDLIDAVHYYVKKSRRKVTFEYILIKEINDNTEDAEKLGKLLQNVRCKINLIPFNSTGNTFTRPSGAKIDSFFRTLNKYGRQVNIRWSEGEDIHAACGQLLYNQKK